MSPVPNIDGVALNELIDAVVTRNGWPDAELTRSAARKGYKLTSSDVSNYRKLGMKQLSPEKVVALAAAMEVPAYRVAVAVLADLGIIVPLDMTTPERAISQDTTLPVEMKRTLLLIIQQARADGSGR